MNVPSGEKNGFDAAPSKFVSRRAAPPVRGTTQMSLPYANVISVALTDGERSIRVCSGAWPRARDGPTHSASSEQKARFMALTEYGKGTAGVGRDAGSSVALRQRHQDASDGAGSARTAGGCSGRAARKMGQPRKVTAPGCPPVPALSETEIERLVEGGVIVVLDVVLLHAARHGLCRLRAHHAVRRPRRAAIIVQGGLQLLQLILCELGGRLRVRWGERAGARRGFLAGIGRGTGGRRARIRSVAGGGTG